jgi:uncharacterized protein
MSNIKETLLSDIKEAMKQKKKEKLKVLRSLVAAIKQIEIDKRIELENDDIIAIFDKQAKLRRESLSQFKAANREDLAKIEEYELSIILSYLPAQLSKNEIIDLINDVIKTTSAKSIKDMGKVMALLKPKVKGKADMGDLSKMIKNKLSNV